MGTRRVQRAARAEIGLVLASLLIGPPLGRNEARTRRDAPSVAAGREGVNLAIQYPPIGVYWGPPSVGTPLSPVCACPKGLEKNALKVGLGAL